MIIDLTDDQCKYLIRLLVSNYADQLSDFSPNDIGDVGTKGLLIGKLAGPNRSYWEEYCKAKDNRYVSQPLTKPLFMGAGYISTVNLNQLHIKLASAASNLSAIEQNGGQGTEFDDVMDKECTTNIKQALKDIIAAFGYKPEDLNDV